MKTILTPSTPRSANNSPKKSSITMKLLPIAAWMRTLIGCAHCESPRRPEAIRRRPRPLAICHWLLAIAALAPLGCAHYKVIEADKTVRRLKAQQPFIAPSDGWFVPDARLLTLLEKLKEAKGELLHRLNDLDASVARLDERTKK